MAILCAGLKAYGLLISFAVFQQTELTADAGTFLFRRPDQTRGERVEEVRSRFWQRLTPYDGQWYLDIAHNGYRSLDPTKAKQKGWPPGNYAFFPLLPGVLVAAHSALGSDLALPAVLLLLAACSACGLFFAGLLGERIGAPPLLGVLLIATFPSFAFQYVLYTEGLFLMISGLCLLLVHRRAWKSAAVAALIAGLCRPQGVLLGLPLAVGLAIEFRRVDKPERFRKAVAFAPLLVAPAVGFLTMSVVGRVVAESSTAFVDIQSSWGRGAGPLKIVESVVDFFGYSGPPMDRVGFLFGVAMLPIIWRRLSTPLAAYATGMVVLPLLTGSLLSYARFISVSIPHFLAAAILLQERPRLAFGVIVVSAVFQVLLMKGLIGWHFVG